MNIWERKDLPGNQLVQIAKYNASIDRLDTLSPMVDRAYLANADFFEYQAQHIEVNFVYSDEELASAMPYPFQPWHKAFARGNRVWVFSPTQPKGDYCERRLTHEIAHVFTNQKFGAANPNWLQEGIATFVANQYPEMDGLAINTSIGFDQLHYPKDWQSHPKYKRADFFIKFLIGKYGKDTLFDLMTRIVPEIGSGNSPEQFAELFGSVYSIKFEGITREFVDMYSNSND